MKYVFIVLALLSFMPDDIAGMNLVEVSIEVPRLITQELQRYNQSRTIRWVGINRVLYIRRGYDCLDAMIFDIRTGDIVEIPDIVHGDSVVRIDREESIIWLIDRGQNMRTINYEPDPKDMNPPAPVRLEYRTRGVFQGSSFNMLREIRSDGTVIEGEWEEHNELKERMGIVSPSGLGFRTILDVLPDGRTVLLGEGARSYIATIDNLQFTDMRRLHGSLGLNDRFIDNSYIIKLEQSLVRGPLGGVGGPSVVYPVVIDWNGEVVAEFPFIETPTIGYMDYDPVMKRIVILELIDDDFASTKVSVYQLEDWGGGK